MSAQLTADFNEGRYVDLGCTDCHSDVRARLEFAFPVRYYVGALCCPECSHQLVEFDVITGEIQ